MLEVARLLCKTNRRAAPTVAVAQQGTGNLSINGTKHGRSQVCPDHQISEIQFGLVHPISHADVILGSVKDVVANLLSGNRPKVSVLGRSRAGQQQKQDGNRKSLIISRLTRDLFRTFLGKSPKNLRNFTCLMAKITPSIKRQLPHQKLANCHIETTLFTLTPDTKAHRPRRALFWKTSERMRPTS